MLWACSGKNSVTVAKSQELGALEGKQTLTWAENMLYVSIMVMMFCCVPMIEIVLSTITYDVDCSKQCELFISAKPSETSYQQLANKLNDQLAKVSLWWYFGHALSKGVTNATTSSIRCSPDLRQIRFEVQHRKITVPI